MTVKPTKYPTNFSSDSDTSVAVQSALRVLLLNFLVASSRFYSHPCSDLSATFSQLTCSCDELVGLGLGLGLGFKVYG